MEYLMKAELSAFKDWLNEEKKSQSSPEDLFFNFVKKGELSIVAGARTIEKRIFSYWVGLHLAKQHSVIHYTIGKEPASGTYFQGAQIPSALYKGIITGEEIDEIQVVQLIKTRLEKQKAESFLILNYENKSFAEHGRDKIAKLIALLNSELKNKVLGIVLFINIKRTENWESLNPSQLCFSPETLQEIDQLIGFCSSPKKPGYSFIKSLNENQNIYKQEVLVLKNIFEFGNYHFEPLGWDKEWEYLAIHPELIAFFERAVVIELIKSIYGREVSELKNSGIWKVCNTAIGYIIMVLDNYCTKYKKRY